MAFHRPRGRPKKNLLSTVSSIATEPCPRSRGRPPKSSYSNTSSPVANVPCPRGRGKPLKRPDNPSLLSFGGLFPQPVTKKPRTKAVTILNEGVTFIVPNLVNPLERTQTLVQDDIEREKSAHWNDKKKRNDRKGKRESNSRSLPLEECESNPHSPPSDEYLRPWMWDMQIPGPIPDDVFALGWNDNLLSDFFNFF
ncbi:hypothetical protein Acr_01g0003970 [Actinidia rufa]|uniref:Uncharacterized protein n=1 Tax=Actinidia rufa TaxID=165716 RepID=A0A7J0E2G3_9ERIC|nr:hypothetical protein Acr_01g0003970 [Actinidia rufa]